MQNVLLEREYPVEALAGQFAAPPHAERAFRRSTRLIAEGRTIALLLHNRIPPELQRRAFQVFSAVDDSVENRVQAVGTHSLPIRRNKDGRLSRFLGVNKDVLKADHLNARQGIAGLHNGRVKHREMLDANRELIEQVDRRYRKYLPDLYAKQKETAKHLPFRMWHTPFTTLYIAKNFRTACHKDSGNLPGVMTAILPLGDFTGGELVLPRWRIGFAYKPGDILYFDPQELHGNLPIQGERISLALYCAR